jgi:hypothetical protein
MSPITLLFSSLLSSLRFFPCRVSLSNMQPSFVWVDVAGEKKSDVLNEVVVCTMSAAKVSLLLLLLLSPAL